MSAPTPDATALARRRLPEIRARLAATRPTPIEQRRQALAAMTRTHHRITGARP